MGIPSDDVDRRRSCSVRRTDGVGVVVYFRQLGAGGAGGAGGVPPPLPGTFRDRPIAPAHPPL